MNSRNVSRVLAIALLAAPTPRTFAQELLNHWWQPDGPVYSVVEDEANGVVYVGGAFNKIGPPMYGGTPLDRNTGLPVHTAPLPNAQAYDVVPDGQGGYYLGGAFTAVDGQPRNRVAHVSANGELLPFGGAEGSGFDAGTVERMLLHDGVLYVQHRERNEYTTIAPEYWGPVDGNDGALLWNGPVTDEQVEGVLPGPGSGWYMWGAFRHVAGQRREGLARVGGNGALHPWDPQVNGAVSIVKEVGDVLYVAGCFTSVGGQPRKYMAAIDRWTGEAMPFNVQLMTAHGLMCPAPYTVLPHAGKVYIRGTFEFVNGMNGNERWLDGVSGQIAAPPFDANGPLTNLFEHDGTAWVIGEFDTINGNARMGMAMIDMASGTVLPNTFSVEGGRIDDMRFDDDHVFLIGNFTAINGEPRPGVAKVDHVSGELLPWLPQASGPIRRLELSNGSVYISGTFTMVDGQQRRSVAAVDPVDAQVTPWQHQQDNTGRLLGTNGSAVFLWIGNILSLQSGFSRLVALDAVTGSPTGWEVSAGGVREMMVVNDQLVLAGCFSWVAGVPRQGLASVDLVDGQVLPWAPAVNGCVRSAALHNDELYICGTFTQVSGEARDGMAAVSMDTGVPLPFEAVFNGNGGEAVELESLAVGGDTLYVVGRFWEANGQWRANMAAFDLTSGLLTEWAPKDITDQLDPPEPWTTPRGINSVAISGDTLFIGGVFAYIFSTEIVLRRFIAAIDRHTGVALNEFQRVYGIPGRMRSTAGSVFALLEVDTWNGESLNWTGGGDRVGLVILDAVTGRPVPAQIDLVGEVRAMAISDGYLYLGGSITEVQGQPVSGIVKIDLGTGSLVQYPAPVPWGGEPHAMAVFGPYICVGSVSGLSVYDVVTGEQLTWPLEPNGRVRALSIHNGVLYMGGDFSAVSGQSRQKWAAIDLVTTMLTDWAPLQSSTLEIPRDLSASMAGVALGGISSTQGQLRPGGFAVVTTLDGAVLPPERPISDTNIPVTTVVAAQGNEAVSASTWSPNAPHQGGWAYVETFHLPTGGTGNEYMFAVSNWQQDNWGPLSNGALFSIHLSSERAFFGGMFLQVHGTTGAGRFRHNLAVFSRPIRDEVRLSPRVVLGGTGFDGTFMSDSLRALALLPGTEPYQGLGYVHALHGGGESADPPVFATAGAAAVVDWVTVELRNATDPTQVIATRSALLRRDGQVKDVDGVSPVAFGVPRTEYHVAIRHRNHLGVMTGEAIPLSKDPATIDFSDPLLPTFGVDAQKEVGGIRVLWPGDANFDGLVKYTGADNDRDAVLQAIGGANPVNVVTPVYATEDVNLDGAIKYVGANNDRDVILQTIGGGTPTAVRVEQVP
jgi:hypothetical protein